MESDLNDHWPTPELPPAPVSVQTHGPVSGWTELYEWMPFHKWALSLKNYGPKTKNIRRSKNRIQATTEKPNGA